MNNVYVFSKIPNLLKELKIILPNINFREILSVKDEQLKQAEILITDFDSIGPCLYSLENTKWVQGTWAGVDALLPHIQPNYKPPFLITRFSGPHFGRIMSEYVIACIISHERNWKEVFENQDRVLWNKDGKIGTYRIISDLHVGILGIGNIGSSIANHLNFLGAKVHGYGRSTYLENSELKLTKYYSKNTFPQFLKSCDYIINILPSTPDTMGLLNGNVLKHCEERKPVFINIGRGSIIDEHELIQSLEKGWLSHAILDVFYVEPLPSDNQLWKMNNVTISPHVAGISRPKDIAEQFRDNYELYLSKKKIPTAVDVSKGY